MKTLKLRFLVLAALLALPAVGLAQTATANLSVVATVQAACSIDAAALGFGIYDPNADLDQNTTITVRCTQGASFWVGLADAGARQMVPDGGGVDRLNYELYRTAADRTAGTVWTDADPGVGSHIAAGNVGYSAYTLDLYGRVPSGQWVPADTYRDTVVMTVNF